MQRWMSLPIKLAVTLLLVVVVQNGVLFLGIGVKAEWSWHWMTHIWGQPDTFLRCGCHCPVALNYCCPVGWAGWDDTICTHALVHEWEMSTGKVSQCWCYLIINLVLRSDGFTRQAASYCSSANRESPCHSYLLLLIPGFATFPRPFMLDHTAVTSGLVVFVSSATAGSNQSATIGQLVNLR